MMSWVELSEVHLDRQQSWGLHDPLQVLVRPLLLQHLAHRIADVLLKWLNQHATMAKIASEIHQFTTKFPMPHRLR